MEMLAASDNLFAPSATESSMLEIPPHELALLMAQCPSTVDTLGSAINAAHTSTLAPSSFDWDLPLATTAAAAAAAQPSYGSGPSMRSNNSMSIFPPAAPAPGPSSAAGTSLLDLSLDGLFALRSDVAQAPSPVSSLSDADSQSYSGSLDDGFAHLDFPDFLIDEVAASVSVAGPATTAAHSFAPPPLPQQQQQQQFSTLAHQLLQHVAPSSVKAAATTTTSRPATNKPRPAKRRSPSATSSPSSRSLSSNGGTPPAKRTGRRASVTEEEDEMLARASTALSQSIRPEDISRARRGAMAAGLEAEETARRLSLKAARERAAAERCGFNLTEDGEFENPEEKRTVMNILERARREDLKTCFHRLRDVIPELAGKASASKGAILKRGAEIIAELELEGQALEAQLAVLRRQNVGF